MKTMRRQNRVWGRTGIVAVTIILLLSSSGLLAVEKNPVRSSLESKEPIQVVADRLEAFDAEKLVVFSGHAVAVQGDKVIKSDKISLYYKKEKTPAAKPGREISPAGDLERIEARGHVSVTQGSKVVTGDLAIYYQDEQKIVMTGNPLMRDGSNTVAGDRIVVYLNENRGVVERSDNKRVTATIYPADKPEAKPKKEKKK
jgi:lipopolysaccharide export system protein LptA